MGLNVDVFGAKELFGPVDGKTLDLVYHLAPTVVPLTWITLGVLVGKFRAQRFEYRTGDKILRRYKLQAFLLPSDLPTDQSIDSRVDRTKRQKQSIVGHRSERHTGCALFAVTAAMRRSASRRAARYVGIPSSREISSSWRTVS